MTALEKIDLFRRLRILGRGRDKSEKSVSLPLPLFEELMKAAVGEMVTDSWYLNRYPDVDTAIRKGFFKRGADHFAISGLYEGRVPYAIEIDEAEYLKQHRDVARAIDAGTFTSASDHFYQSGYAEGRAFRLIERA